MADQGSGSSWLWKELKDRKVFHGITVYVAVAFGILELIDIVTGPLHLPGWMITVFIFLSIAGFPVAVIVSWNFDLTPQGIRRYKVPPVPVDQDLAPEPSPEESTASAEDDAAGPQPLPESGKRMERYFGLGSVVIIGLVIVSFLFFSGKSAPFEERDWVLIGDFINHTDEAIFDASLTTAFELSIDQSRHINVIPRKRIHESLTRIGKPAGSFIDENLCREIAMREGVRVYIIPEISRVGHQYILTGKLQEAETGALFRSEVIYAQDQDEIIPKLDRLSKKMRRYLGESRYKISGQSKPLVKVTTASLDALKQYSMAIEYHLNLDFENAVTHYRNAIRLDSSFTSAKASLGNILYERFDREEGKKWLDEAILSIDNLTEKEKNGILAFYAANVENDLEKSIAYTRANIELYPDSPADWNNLGWYFQSQERYREALRAYKVAIRLDPYTFLPYGGLIWIYMDYLGDMDSAQFWSKRLITYGPDNPWGYFYLGSAQVGLNKPDQALKNYLKARELDPRMNMNLYRLSHTYQLLDQPEESAGILNSILENSPGEASVHYDLGIVYEILGDHRRSVDQLEQFLKIAEGWEETYPDLPDTYIALGAVLTRLGRLEEGFSAGQKAMAIDSSFHFKYAELLSIQGKTDEALEHLEMALKKGYRNVCWIRMDPDLSEIRMDERFEKLIDRYFPS